MRALFKPSPVRFLHGIAAVAGLCLILVAVYWMFVGRNAAYMSDDFCLSSRVNSMGLLGSDLWWYNNWTGRYAFIGMLNLLLLPGEKLLPLFTAGAILLFSLSWYFAFYQISSALGAKRTIYTHIKAFGISLVILFGVFSFTPRKIESLFWITGATNYFTPFIILGLITGFLAWVNQRKKYNWTASISLAVLGFAFAGFAESLTLIATISLGVIMSLKIGILRKNRILFNSLSALLCGLSAGLIMMLASPGNVIRLSFTATLRPAPVDALIKAGDTASSYILGAISSQAIFVILLCGVCSFLFFSTDRKKRIAVVNTPTLLAATLLFLLAALLLFYTTIFFSYGLQAHIPERVLIIPSFLMVLSSMTVGALLSLTTRTKTDGTYINLLYVAAVAIILITPTQISQANQASITLKDYRASKARFESTITNTPNHVVEERNNIHGILGTDIQGIGKDSNSWINECIAKYYHKDNIRLVDDGISEPGGMLK